MLFPGSMMVVKTRQKFPVSFPCALLPGKTGLFVLNVHIHMWAGTVGDVCCTIFSGGVLLGKRLTGWLLNRVASLLNPDKGSGGVDRPTSGGSGFLCGCD